MQHFLLLVVVLTAITYVSLFLATSKNAKTAKMGDSNHPQNDSLQSEVIPTVRESTQEKTPGPSKNAQSKTSKYMVLGLG